MIKIGGGKLMAASPPRELAQLRLGELEFKVMS
jgi:hypothetical protein